MSRPVSGGGLKDSADLRLRGRAAVALRGALRRGHLADGQQGRAGAAVQHKDLALLGRLHERGHAIAVDAQVQQAGLGRHVVVPEVVVHGLEVPAHLAGGQVQRDDRGRIGFDRRAALAAPLVGRLVAQGHVDHAQRFVDAGNRPAVGRVGRVGFWPGERRAAVGPAGIPGPDQAPVLTSKARMTPDCSLVETLSSTVPPTMRRRASPPRARSNSRRRA
jgi:hypothetical protein